MTSPTLSTTRKLRAIKTNKNQERDFVHTAASRTLEINVIFGVELDR